MGCFVVLKSYIYVDLLEVVLGMLYEKVSSVWIYVLWFYLCIKNKINYVRVYIRMYIFVYGCINSVYKEKI